MTQTRSRDSVNDELRALASRAGGHNVPKLRGDEQADALRVLGDWKLADDAIIKTFSFADYAETIGFVNAVAWLAQRLDHHPDLQVGYNRCTVLWTTHDAGGVTMNDVIAAARTELLLA